MTRRALVHWLDYIERIHPKSIELGLERVAAVRDAMGLANSAAIITVAGTNGKGSTCAMLEAILLAAGYRVGLYTSPHLLRYNERVRVNGAEVDDERLCEAFEAVESARRGVPLTYFEFGTLAAWWIFACASLDAVVLEVGLGGRLDAVNAFDCDCGVLTVVGIDHVEYLGGDRESIGAEKAGIFRPGRPAIVADPDPPRSVLAYARAIGAELRLLGRDFGYRAAPRQWSYWNAQGERTALDYPALRGARQIGNAAAAITALGTLRGRLPVAMQHVRRGLASAVLPGRFQLLPGRPAVVLDVAHNPQAAAVLAENLDAMGFYSRTFAVLGMLRDKDIAGVCRALCGRISAWFLADLSGPRAASAQDIRRALEAIGDGAEVFQFSDPALAFAAARERAGENDRIVVFGSFHTVAEVLKTIPSVPGPAPAAAERAR